MSGRTILVYACEAVWFTKKIRPANWYGSKDGMSRGGVALNALGCLTLLARPLMNH
jgi:hypothetical protein